MLNGWIGRRLRSRPLWVVMLIVLGTIPQAYAWKEFQAAKSASLADLSDEAKIHLRHCRHIWPWDGQLEVKLLASRVARQSGDLQTAISELKAARKLAGEANAEIAFEWSLIQATDGNVADVAEYLQQKATGDPYTQRLVWEAMTEGFLAVYRANDAYTVAQQWVMRFPDDLKALELRGRAAVQGRGRGLKLGVEDFRQVLLQDPSRIRVRAALAVTLLELGLFSEAIPELELIVRAQPENSDYKVRLARCLNMTNRTDEAIRLLDEVLRATPDHGMALRTRGQFALGESKQAEAEKWLKKAAEALPNDYQTQFLYYQALQSSGNPQLADAQLQKAENVRSQTIQLSDLRTRRLAARPLDPALYVELGEILLKTGHDNQGLRWLSEALSLDPNFRPAHLIMADYYEKNGKPDLAAPHRRMTAVSP